MTEQKRADSHSLFGAEAPRYASLRLALLRSHAAVLAAWERLYRRWFLAAGLSPPRKAELSAVELRAVDAAIEAFMREMAGRNRSREGFVGNDEPLVQNLGYLGHRVGQGRAADLLEAPPPGETLTERVKRQLNENAFERLTENGRLRFEDRLGEIRQAMVDGFDAGDSPTEIARRLSADLTGYERGRLETITVTEVAIASEQAIQEEFRAQGVERFEVIGNPETDEECTQHFDAAWEVGDADHIPPFHPRCLCSAIPFIEEAT
jgi:hypothetical protein